MIFTTKKFSAMISVIAQVSAPPSAIQTLDFFFSSTDFSQQIYSKTNFKVLREYVSDTITSYDQINTKQCGNYLHFLTSNNLLDLQFVQLQVNLPTHKQVQIQFNFYKTGIWSDEEFSVIVDGDERTFNKANDQTITCENWQNYAYQQVNFKKTHNSNTLTILIKSRANLDISKWSIGQVIISAFDCPINSFFVDQTKECFQCQTGCQSCYNQNQCNQCQNEYYLQKNGSCVQSCDSYQYALNNACENCPSACLKCDQNYCTQCQDVNKDTSKKCNTCKAGFLISQQSNTCIQCDIQGCQEYDSTYCQCKSYTAEYVCLNQSNQKCQKQIYQNNQCICQECSSNYISFQGDCVSNCPIRYGYDSVTKTCQSCSLSNCLKCQQNFQQCDQCDQVSLMYSDQNQIQCIQQKKCFDSYYLDSGKCIKCSSNCLTCSRVQTCTQCQQGLISMKYNIPNMEVSQYSCSQTNDDNYFVQQCKSNLNSFYPQTETPKYYQIQSELFCAAECPLGQGYNPQKNTCSKCIDSCENCSNNSSACYQCKQNFYSFNFNNVYQCLDKCPNGYYIYGSTCVQNCPIGYGHLDPNGKNECLSCSVDNCLLCDSQQVCSKCQENKLLDKSTNKCIDTCPDNYFYQQSSQSCIICSSNCSKCENQESNCISCKTGLFLFYQNINNTAKCVETCPEKYYEKQGYCSSCPLNCQICDRNGVCQQCQSSFMIYNQQCVSCPNQDLLIDNQCQYCKERLLKIEDGTCIINQDCGEGYFIEKGLCKKCGLMDEQCSDINSQEEINKCSKYQTQQGKCSWCYGQAMYFQNGWCVPCPEGCSSCNQSGKCFQCSSDQYCYIQSLQICRKITPDFTCQDMNQKQCKQIIDSNHGYCLKCSQVSLNQCIICDTNSFLFNSECLLKCPKPYFADRNVYEQKYIYSGVCRPSCLQGYTHDQSEYCFYCPNSCKCQQLTDSAIIALLNQNYLCTQCEAGYKKIYISDTYKNIFNCVLECPKNFYLDVDKQECIQCTKGCLQCENTYKCTQCDLGYFFQPLNNSCVFECEQGQYKDNYEKKCLQCGSKNCLQCYSLTYCYKCDSQSYLYQNSCKSNCDDGQYQEQNDGLQCKPCEVKDCKSCNNSSTCSICKDSTYLQDQGSKCVSQCSDGYSLVLIQGVNKCIKNCGQSQYLPINSEICLACPSGCLQCEQGICNQCKQAYRFDSVNKICQQCQDELCLNCDNNVKQCQVCQQGYIYDKSANKCIKNCQNGQTYDVANSQCINCPKNCSSCILKDFCNVCQKGFYLDEQRQCSQCNINCKTCQNDSKNCLSCESSYQLQNNKCVITCDYSCLTCSGNGDSQCLSCSSSRFLYLGRCVCKEGFIEKGSQQCEKDDTSQQGIKSLQNGLTSITAALMTTGMAFPTGIKCLEVSSMVSFLTYSNAKYQGKVDQYLQILYTDNISPLIPNFILSAFPKVDQSSSSDNGQMAKDKRLRILQEFVDVNKQYQSDFRFMKNSKTINYLINIAPLLTIYAIFSFILLVKYLIFRFTKLGQSQSKIVTFINLNLRSTLFLLIFYLSYQELLLITLLQITSMFQGGALNIISSLICIVSIIFIIFMIYLIIKIALFISYISFKEKAEKYGPLFYGFKENKLSYSFLIIRIIQKTLICLITIFGGHLNISFYFLIITSLAYVYEILVRPLKSLIAQIVSLLLNGLYFLIILFSYLIENNEDIQIQSQYSSHLEKALLAFIILKNSALMIETILFILILVKRFRQKTGTLNNSKDLSNLTFDLESSLQKEIQWRDNVLKKNNVKTQIQKMKTGIIQNENSFDDSNTQQKGVYVKQDQL